MNPKQKYQVDMSQLDPEQREKVELFTLKKEQLGALQDISALIEELVLITDKKTENNESGKEDFTQLLKEIRGLLKVQKGVENLGNPNFARPLVNSLGELRKALSDATQTPTKVDFSEVERALTVGVPKALKDAVSKIKLPENEKTDLTPLLQIMQEMSEKLDSIDNGTRMKPQGVNAKIINSSSSPIPTTSSGDIYDLQTENTGTYTYVGEATPGTATSAATWRIYRVVNATSVKRFADGVATFTKEWDERASYTYIA